MPKFPIRINDVRVKADHNLFILSTTDKNNRLLIKLFYSTAEKIAAGFEKPSVYKLEYSGYRWDANEFMTYYKKKLFTDKLFDGWMSYKVLANMVAILENKDYDKYSKIYKEEVQDSFIFHYNKPDKKLRGLQDKAKADLYEFRRIYNC